MNSKEIFREILIIIIAVIILGLAVAYPDNSLIIYSIISFLIIITLNVLIKKSIAYYFEADVKIKFWSWSQYLFPRKSHFKKPIPMIWLPLVLSFFSQGLFGWLGILGFDVKAKTERVSKRHGLYRFSEMTDWHIALIATAGVIINLIAAIIAYLIGFELFARLSIYFAVWSILPIGSLDGSKIFYGSRPLWFTLLVIVALFLGWAIVVV